MNKIKFFIHFVVIAIKMLFDKFKYQKEDKQQCYQRLQYYSRRLIKKSGIDFIIENQLVKDDKTTLYIANHQGTLDPIFLLASIDKNFSFISKKSNQKIPIIGTWGKLIGNIYFDRESLEGNIKMLRESINYLKSGKDILIFPEGTRSKSNNMNDFKPNSLKIAFNQNIRIVPITLNNAYCLDAPCKNKQVSIYFHKPLEYADYKEYTEKELRLMIQDIIKSKIKA